MLAYKHYQVIQDPKELKLTNLPFSKGQRVEIVILADDQASEDEFSLGQEIIAGLADVRAVKAGKKPKRMARELLNEL